MYFLSYEPRLRSNVREVISASWIVMGKVVTYTNSSIKNKNFQEKTKGVLCEFEARGGIR